MILMGMSKLNEIVEVFRGYGKENTPVGIIQNGTTENERSGFGTIKNIEEIVAEKDLNAPAIIVIGEVVRESGKIQSLLKSKVEEGIILNSPIGGQGAFYGG